jgi:DNA-binding transcriptional LysR family regulator
MITSLSEQVTESKDGDDRNYEIDGRASQLREPGRRLVVFEPPIEIPGFDVIAVWHPRVDKDVAHRWLRTRLADLAKAP